MASNTKIRFAMQVQEASRDLAKAIEKCSSLASMYADRGYAAEGANPLTGDDLDGSGLEVTPAQLAGFAAMVAALNTIGVTVPELLGWSGLLNQLRND